MIEELYAEQALKRPLSEIQDYALLAAQVDIGGRAPDPERCLAALKNEMAALPRCDGEEALYERLSGGLCRLNLRAAAARGLTAETIADAYLDYLRRFRPDPARLKNDLFALKRMCERDELPVNGATAAYMLGEIRRTPPAKWRHSAAYVLRYKPAYRVMFITAAKRLTRGD